MITCWPSLYAPAHGRPASFRALILRARAPQTYARKDAPPRFAAAEFRDGYRDLAHFERAYAIVLDIDDVATRAQIVDAFPGVYVVAYTTWTAGHWRAVLPLDRPVTTAEDEFRRVQRACIELAEQGGLDAEKGQSAAHCFALPARGGSAYEFLELGGAFFDVDAALERFPKPEPMPRIERARADGDSYAQRRTRAARYLERMPGAISGSGGHAATFAAACAMVRGFELDPADALELLAAIHNPRCSPPWSVRELRHKVKSAHQRATLPFGYLAERRDGRAA